MYLDAASVDRTLAFVASHSAPGSAIVFDYLCEEPAPPPKRDIVDLLVSIFRSFSKELRNFAIGEEQIEAFLETRGFHQVRNVSGADILCTLFQRQECRPEGYFELCHRHRNCMIGRLFFLAV